MSEIVLRSIRKSFDGHLVLDGIDLEVPAGEFLVVVGPSGCGKTTLLRAVAGLETVDEGDILFGGRRVNGVAPRDRGVAMVFQSYALYPHMSVRENIAFGLTLRKTPRAEIEARVAEVAALLELTALLDRRPAALSGGQRQRVAIGRALARRPNIFLFDEPLSNLDAALRVQMRGEIARLHRRVESTMVYVTHDQVEAMTLATRLALLGGGRLQQAGPPLELYKNPANRTVAAFLGQPSMNFLPARAEGGRLKGRGFSLPLPEDASGLGGDCLLGIRPQSLRVSDDGSFRGRVEALERLGFEGYAFLETEAGPLAASFDESRPVAIGDAVSVSLEESAFHVFSADGARALRHPAEERPINSGSLS